MFKKFKHILMAAMAACFVSAGSAMAAVDLTGYTVDTTTPETLAGIVLAGLGVMWGIRKLIKLINRS
jgi:hypothetical protein